MKTRIFAVGLVALLTVSDVGKAQTPSAEESATGCLFCHKGIEPIREAGSLMLQAIVEMAESEGDPDGCVVCHGGDPDAEDKETAHGGNAFYPDPGSSWINENTCGQCHSKHVRVQWHSLMMTEAGKIQGVAWTFGSLTGYVRRRRRLRKRQEESSRPSGETPSATG